MGNFSGCTCVCINNTPTDIPSNDLTSHDSRTGVSRADSTEVDYGEEHGSLLFGFILPQLSPVK